MEMDDETRVRRFEKQFRNTDHLQFAVESRIAIVRGTCFDRVTHVAKPPVPMDREMIDHFNQRGPECNYDRTDFCEHFGEKWGVWLRSLNALFSCVCIP